MRTPGRCTNLEGCWIGATQRDVWLSIGEDFACPNCSGALRAPPRRSVSTAGIKKAAGAMGAAAVGVAAVLAVGIKLSTLQWAAQPVVVVGRHWNGQASRYAWSHMAPPVATATMPEARPTQTQLATASPTRPAPSQDTDAGDDQDSPSLTLVKPPAPRALASLIQDAPPGKSLPSSVLVFADPRGYRAGHQGMSDATANHDNGATENDNRAVEAALITVVSEAAFAPSRQAERPIILPISFGKPEAPEDDMPPVSMRWRYHLYAPAPSSYFLPGPAAEDALTRISRSPALLR